MTQRTPDDRKGSDRPVDAGQDLAPPAAPLPMPRQSLESPVPAGTG